MGKVAFLLTSCDTYSDLWKPFFICLERHWPDIPYPVYLNTEHKQFDSEGYSFKVKTINQQTDKKLSWSKRFYDCLKEIPEEYVFITLDDYFFIDKVKTEYIEEIVEKMENDSMIASVQLGGARQKHRDKENYKNSPTLEFELVGKDVKAWKMQFIPTVWRKSVLLKRIRKWETIWAFESYGSERWDRWHYKEKVYLIRSTPVYDFYIYKDVAPVVNGKWLWEPQVQKDLEEMNLDIDYDARGKITWQEFLDVSFKDILKRYTFWQKVVKVINRVRSIF